MFCSENLSIFTHSNMASFINTLIFKIFHFFFFCGVPEIGFGCHTSEIIQNGAFLNKNLKKAYNVQVERVKFYIFLVFLNLTNFQSLKILFDIILIWIFHILLKYNIKILLLMYVHPAKKVFEHLRYFVSKNLY